MQDLIFDKWLNLLLLSFSPFSSIYFRLICLKLIILNYIKWNAHELKCYCTYIRAIKACLAEYNITLSRRKITTALKNTYYVDNTGFWPTLDLPEFEEVTPIFFRLMAFSFPPLLPIPHPSTWGWICGGLENCPENYIWSQKKKSMLHVPLTCDIIINTLN